MHVLEQDVLHTCRAFVWASSTTVGVHAGAAKAAPAGVRAGAADAVPGAWNAAARAAVSRSMTASRHWSSTPSWSQTNASPPGIFCFFDAVCTCEQPMVRPSSVSRQKRHRSEPSARFATGCSHLSSETSSSTSSNVFAQTAHADGDAFAAHSGQ